MYIVHICHVDNVNKSESKKPDAGRSQHVKVLDYSLNLAVKSNEMAQNEAVDILELINHSLVNKMI